MNISPLILLTICSFFLWSCGAKRAANNVEKIVTKEETPALDSARFDIKRFEEKKRKDGPPNYKFVENERNIRQWSDTPDRDSPDSLKYYVEEISTRWQPFIIRKKYDYKGRLRRWSQTFRLESYNKAYEYDESGKVIKITNYEDRYKHSFVDIREFLLKKKGIDIYDTRQAIARRVNHKSQINPEAYYDINVISNKAEKDYRIVIFDDTLEIKEYR